MNNDLEQLKLLSIFHYVVAGILGLFSCFPVFHLMFGIFFLVKGDELGAQNPEGPPPEIFGLLFTIIPALIIVVGWACAICVFLAGRFLSTQTHYTFCFVIACVMCAFFPFGTVLGIFSIIVLIRPSVKQMFDGSDFTDLESV